MKYLLLLTTLIAAPSMASAQTIPDLINDILNEIVGGDGGDSGLSAPNSQAVADDLSAFIDERCGAILPTLRAYREADLGRELQAFDVFPSLSPAEEACRVINRHIDVYSCRYRVAWNNRPEASRLATDASGTPRTVIRLQELSSNSFAVRDCNILLPDEDKSTCFDNPRGGVEQLERLREAARQRQILEARQHYQDGLVLESVALSLLPEHAADYREALSVLTTMNGCGLNGPPNERILNPGPLTRGLQE